MKSRRFGRPREFRVRARLVVFLEADELAAARDRASAEGISVSMFARAALRDALGKERRTKMLTQLARPLRFTGPELAKFGVAIMDRRNLSLACEKCGQRWWPMLRRGGKLPRGYWRCPNRCNAPA
jgi:hypothetical protein